MAELEMKQYFLKGRRKDYKRGDRIYQMDEAPLGMYLVDKGLVGLVIIGEKGHEHLVRLFKPGEVFGHRSLFSNERYHATATALDETSVSFLPKEDVRSLMGPNCEVAEFFLGVLARELKIAEQKQIALSEKDVSSRIAETVVFLKERYPDHLWTRQEIADYCGSTAATVIRTLAKFEELGWIEQVGRDIKILDRNALLEGDI